MLSKATDGKPVRAQNPVSTQPQPQPKVSQSLPCPRCESTSTKFCYYNNYNLSQPRHFCKSCRRYWTQGGTLRNIPVGGGFRKNSKRTRFASGPASATTDSLSCSSTVTNERVGPPAAFPCGVNPEAEMKTDVNLIPGSGSFTNMLNMQTQGQNFLGMDGFHGYGIGSGLEELELGFATTRSWEIPGAGAGADSGCSTWQMMNEDDHQGGNGVDEDCFGWSGLALFPRQQ